MSKNSEERKYKIQNYFESEVSTTIVMNEMLAARKLTEDEKKEITTALEKIILSNEIISEKVK